MAKFSDVNFLPATSAEIVFRLKEVMKQAGWVVQSSSDGTTYNATGDQISSSGTGAGGMDNARAWFRIQDPGGTRELTFQLQSGGGLAWRIKYSAQAKFIGGAPSATDTPSATDEVILKGGGTDASPTFSAYFATGGRFHVVCDSTPVNGGYFVVCFETSTTNGNIGYFFCLEPISYASAANNDPMIIVTSNGGFAKGQSASAWYGYGGSDPRFGTAYALAYANATSDTLFPGGLTSNPFNNGDDMIGIPWGSDTSNPVPIGFLGVGAFLRWKGVNRSYPDTVSLTSNARVYAGDVLVPWPDGVAPVL